MTDAIPKAPDALMGEDWAGEMGANWLANLDRFEAMIAPIGAALLDRAGLTPGERCLNIGSGRGATTLEIARRVAPGGIATGIDISPLLVAEATKRSEAAGIANARFVCAVASRVVLDDAPYDRLFSRSGSMFVEQPMAAFTHLHPLLKPGARIDLAVWGPSRENLWMTETMGVVREHVEVLQQSRAHRDRLPSRISTISTRSCAVAAFRASRSISTQACSRSGAWAWSLASPFASCSNRWRWAAPLPSRAKRSGSRRPGISSPCSSGITSQARAC